MLGLVFKHQDFDIKSQKICQLISGRVSDRGSAEGGSKSVELGREADNGHSLARLEPMDQVGGKADTCGGLSTDTAFLFGNVAEGVVAVEPEAVFHGWRPARRECLPGGT